MKNNHFMKLLGNLATSLLTETNTKSDALITANHVPQVLTRGEVSEPVPVMQPKEAPPELMSLDPSMESAVAARLVTKEEFWSEVMEAKSFLEEG